MTPQVPDLVGLRQTEALALLEGLEGIEVRVVPTRPPKSRYRGDPVAWRVVRQRLTGTVLELTVAPEWLPFRTETGEPE